MEPTATFRGPEGQRGIPKDDNTSSDEEMSLPTPWQYRMNISISSVACVDFLRVYRDDQADCSIRARGSKSRTTLGGGLSLAHMQQNSNMAAQLKHAVRE